MYINFPNMSNPIWHNYKTVPEMISYVAGATDCKRFCSGCAKTWADIGEGMVHMVEDTENKTICDSPHKYYCDGCVEEII